MALRIRPPGLDKYQDVESYLASPEFRALDARMQRLCRDELETELTLMQLEGRRNTLVAQLGRQGAAYVCLPWEMRGPEAQTELQHEIEILEAAVAKQRERENKSAAQRGRARSTILAAEERTLVRAIAELATKSPEETLWRACGDGGTIRRVMHDQRSPDALHTWVKRTAGKLMEAGDQVVALHWPNIVSRTNGSKSQAGRKGGAAKKTKK